MSLAALGTDLVLVTISIGERRKGFAAVLTAVGTLTSVHVHVVLSIV